MGLPIFFILVGGAVGVFILRAIFNRLARQEEQRITSRGGCPACGYKRSANVEQPCPECGQSLEAARQAGDPVAWWHVLLAPAVGVLAFMVFVGLAKNLQAPWLWWVFICMVGPYAVATIGLASSRLRKRASLFLPLAITFSVVTTAISFLCYKGLADGVFSEYGPNFDYGLSPFLSFFVVGIPSLVVTWIATLFTAAHESSRSK